MNLRWVAITLLIAAMISYALGVVIMPNPWGSNNESTKNIDRYNWGDKVDYNIQRIALALQGIAPILAISGVGFSIIDNRIRSREEVISPGP